MKNLMTPEQQKESLDALVQFQKINDALEAKIKTLSNIIQNHMSGMTSAQIKAYLVIWHQTHFYIKTSRKITNDEFIEMGGKGLAMPPAVNNATNWLHQKKYIFKVKDNTDSLNYYCINTDFKGVTVL